MPSNLSNNVSVMTNRGVSLRALEKLAERGEVDKGLVHKLARADLNQDGSIGSIEELAAALKLIGAEQALKSSLAAPLSKRRSALQRDLRSEMSERTRPTRGVQRSDALGASSGSSAGASPVAATSGGASSIHADGTLGRFEGGGPVKVSKDANGKANAVQFKADMDVDTDGGTSSLAHSDRYYQSQTSMKWANGKSLNSDKLPFVVLPPSLAKATGANQSFAFAELDDFFSADNSAFASSDGAMSSAASKMSCVSTKSLR